MAADLAEVAAFIAGIQIFKTILWIVLSLPRENKSDHCARSWSDLPWDLLDRILQHLELPGALAVAAVCTSWRSAAVASGVRSGTPWLVSRESEPLTKTKGSEFRNVLDPDKIHMVSYPQGRRNLSWCGASHGWLIASDELSNLLFCNPFTLAMIPLPPITDLECVEGVYDNDRSIAGYYYGNSDKLISPPDYIGRWFYQKVVLSSDPSPSHDGGDYIAMAIYGNNQVSFARARENSWRHGTALSEMGKDSYADCVYHNGRFYTVTMCGVVETWDLNKEPAHEPNKQVIIAGGDGRYRRILTRFLVSTPWGCLLQIRTQRRNDHPRKVMVEVFEVNVEEHKLVRLSSATAFQEHAVFVGLNESVCLHTKDYKELRPNHVYFATPWLTQEANFGLRGWKGVVIYDLENQTFEEVLPASKYSAFCPQQVWFIPNI